MSGIITMVDKELGLLREFKTVPVDSPTEFRTAKFVPTDVVIVDGKRYRMVDRKAKVGEKIIIVSNEMCHGFRVGDIAKHNGKSSAGDWHVEEDDGSDRDYLVLEPLPTEECTGEHVTLSAHAKVIDMFAALAQRLTALDAKLDELADTNERALKRVADRVEENGKNVETLAQDLEAVKAIMLSNEEDIRTLDERTQSLTPKSGAKLLAEAFEALANYERGIGR